MTAVLAGNKVTISECFRTVFGFKIVKTWHTVDSLAIVKLKIIWNQWLGGKGHLNLKYSVLKDNFLFLQNKPKNLNQKFIRGKINFNFQSSAFKYWHVCFD